MNATTTALTETLASVTTTLLADATNTPLPDVHDPAPRHLNAVLAFIIGLAIVTLASVLNAAGLNLTKLDHVCLYLLVRFDSVC
jgi:hypothetical protein